MQKKKKEKKSTHPEKKAQKALQPIKKRRATEKKHKKHYSAFKSTHYDPCSCKEFSPLPYNNDFRLCNTFSLSKTSEMYIIEDICCVW